jgi:hypothetical protein
VRPEGPQRTRWLGNAAGPIGVIAFLLWFARPVLDTGAAKTDRTPGGCSTFAACIHAPIRPPPAETTTPPLPPHQHKVDERTSPSPDATAWPFACLIRRLFTARHQRKCSEPFKHQTAFCTWHLGSTMLSDHRRLSQQRDDALQLSPCPAVAFVSLFSAGHPPHMQRCLVLPEALGHRSRPSGSGPHFLCFTVMPSVPALHQQHQSTHFCRLQQRPNSRHFQHSCETHLRLPHAQLLPNHPARAQTNANKQENMFSIRTAAHRQPQIARAQLHPSRSPHLLLTPVPPIRSC